MAKAARSGASRGSERLPFECIALVLQGGGALGAYQAGVYEALAEAGIHPDWMAGISIGAINSAIIAGNAPAERVGKLKAFWERVTARPTWELAGAWFDAMPHGDFARGIVNQLSAEIALFEGASDFFSPRFPPPFFQAAGSLAATSFYDTAALRSTLEELVDFDRINAGETRLSVGAVNVTSGNFTYFDTTRHRLGPEHVMASGALPPGFPAVEIDGEYYWDGGLISNTPLQWVVMQSGTRADTLAFQVDLWSAGGRFPATLTDVSTRQKEIQFSSRTRANTDQFKQMQELRHALAHLLDKLPPDLRRSEEARLLGRAADFKVYNLVHLIYRSRAYEGDSKDYEFSRRSMRDHWQSGYEDAARALAHPQIFKRPQNHAGLQVFDFAEEQ